MNDLEAPLQFCQIMAPRGCRSAEWRIALGEGRRAVRTFK